MGKIIETNSGRIDAIERSVVKQTHSNIPEKRARHRVISVPKDRVTDLEAYSYPELGDKRMRHNDGKIYIKRFRDTDIQIELPLMPSTHDIGFDSLEIVESEWPELDDMESGIRYCRHIADNFDKTNGYETLSILRLQREIQGFGRELQKPKQDQMTWKELEERASKVIVDAGLDKARDFDKLEIARILAHAVSLDSLGRENSSKTRLELAHVYPRITNILLDNGFKYNKYRYLESVLYQEREKEREPFITFSSMVKELDNPKLNGVEYQNHISNIRKGALKYLATERVRIAPYLQKAVEARYKILGHNTPEDKNVLEKYLGIEKAEELMSAPTYYDLTPEQRVGRLKEIANDFDVFLKDRDEQLPDSAEHSVSREDRFWNKVDEMKVENPHES